MNIILLIIAWLLGLIAGALFLIQPLIVLFFGIPFTIKLKRIGAISGNGPIPSYLGSLIVLPIFLVLTIWGVSEWFPKQMGAYWTGMGFTIIMGLGRCGSNSTNVAEYIETNSKHIDPNVIDQIRPSAQSKTP